MESSENKNGKPAPKLVPYDGSDGSKCCIDCHGVYDLLVYTGEELVSKEDVKRGGGKVVICWECAMNRGTYFFKHRGIPKPIEEEKADAEDDISAPAKDGA